MVVGPQHGSAARVRVLLWAQVRRPAVAVQRGAAFLRVEGAAGSGCVDGSASPPPLVPIRQAWEACVCAGPMRGTHVTFACILGCARRR